jgi:hypothetical protein
VTKSRGRAAKSKGAASPRTPFQLELIRLIQAHGGELGTTSGRSLSARLGKSSNHLWQILNRGMVPSGPAILDIARLLGLTDAETEGLILSAIETKCVARSRDRFWITQAREMVVRREEFLREKGLGQAFSDWEASRRGRAKGPKQGSAPAK